MTKISLYGAAIILLFIIALTIWFIMTPYEYYCYRCCAIKTNRLFATDISQSETSKWLTSEGYANCQHEWILNSYAFGFVDCFASRKIPMAHLHFGKITISRMPDPKWRSDVFAAIMDKDNKLRWVVVETIEKFAPEAERMSNNEWRIWHNDFLFLFTPEYNSIVAQEKITHIHETVKAKYGHIVTAV